ncbi:unnamed protein product [Effrenium voratum]|nr:unnamed protein product [Effrenium voratum]
MAFAADPTMGGLNKAAALKGNLGWKSKEDGSVSNSSNGSTTTGRESGCDDEATKTNRDGSGSSSGSGSTAKAYKESAQDESCSSGSRSEQAQDVQDSEPKQQNSLKTARASWSPDRPSGLLQRMYWMLPTCLGLLRARILC